MHTGISSRLNSPELNLFHFFIALSFAMQFFTSRLFDGMCVLAANGLHTRHKIRVAFG